ncbi:hypothetical protein Dsin_024640 [Dipteronia sinensis]|uniref:Ubiquitin-like protease family profile domain-containing protein n=1 Tax=Dipteronia sinensis TaxID=43782 RepID=A0AAD9ZUD4_9ROSI|nr:hypothetical protein Dsin_024640 [Dipteronia sinensis]
MDQLQYVSPDVDGCVGEDDVEDDVLDDVLEDVQDDVQDGVGNANQNDIEGDHQTRTLKKFEVGGKKNKLITFEKLQKRLDVMQAQQNALQDQMTSMKNSLMDEMRMGFYRLTELICLNKVAKSQDDTFQDYQPSIPHGLKSPEFFAVPETSEDVKQLMRPPKLTIKVLGYRKRSAFTVSPHIDPLVKRLRKPKMPEFGSNNQMDEEILRSMQSWINDNKNTWYVKPCTTIIVNPHFDFIIKFLFFNVNDMNIGLLETKPAWFELLLSPIGWLEGDILFPANVNGNHWVAAEVNLKERGIKVYDSYPNANSVDQILRWATCLPNILPSLLVHAMPDTYNDPTSFAVERPEEGVPHHRNKSDCCVFTLKFLEYLWAGKQFDFEGKYGAPLRVKIATEIFHNSKEVPSVNDAN